MHQVAKSIMQAEGIRNCSLTALSSSLRTPTRQAQGGNKVLTHVLLAWQVNGPMHGQVTLSHVWKMLAEHAVAAAQRGMSPAAGLCADHELCMMKLQRTGHQGLSWDGVNE